jgi:hypothetical protein
MLWLKVLATWTDIAITLFVEREVSALEGADARARAVAGSAVASGKLSRTVLPSGK